MDNDISIYTYVVLEVELLQSDYVVCVTFEKRICIVKILCSCSFKTTTNFTLMKIYLIPLSKLPLYLILYLGILPLEISVLESVLFSVSFFYIFNTDANPLNATHPFTWKGCNFWVVATWREYEILKKIFIVNEI